MVWRRGMMNGDDDGGESVRGMKRKEKEGQPRRVIALLQSGVDTHTVRAGMSWITEGTMGRRDS